MFDINKVPVSGAGSLALQDALGGTATATVQMSITAITYPSSGPRLVAHTAAGSANGNIVTTPGIDTTGATLLVVLASSSFSVANAITDNKGNVFTPLTKYGTNSSVQMFYVVNPVVGAGHTVSNGATGLYPAICIAAFAGTPTFQVGSGNETTGVQIQPGVVTPTGGGNLILCGLALLSSESTATIDAGFTVLDFVNLVASQHYGGALAYLIQGTSAALNPTWAYPTNTLAEATLAVF